MIARRLARGFVLALGACLGLVGCTVEDPVDRRIGTVVPQLVDSNLRTQSVVPDDEPHTVQVAEWTVTRADFTVDEVVTDLTFGQECTFTDTALALTRGTGPCARGVVIGSSLLTRPVTLSLAVTMRVRRAEPLFLSPMDDYDGDGVVNSADNCILIDNPDQTPSPGREFGEACAVRDSFTGSNFADNDRDGVADVIDNCPQIANPEQEDTSGLGGEGIPDGIGDACTEQQAEVEIAGSGLIELDLGPVDLLQAQYQATFLTVDFRSGTALTCDWDAGRCTLDPSAVGFCVLSNSLGICP